MLIDPAVIHASAKRGDLVYPYAIYMPLPENKTQSKIKATQFIFHTEAGPSLTTLESLWKYVNRSDVTGEAHFILDMDGRMAQCIDINTRADNNASANPRAISIETQDLGSATVYKTEWTPQQVQQLAGLNAWCHLNPNCAYPLVPAPAWDKPGYGPHRQYPQWSVYVGKTCPGDARTAQIPGIIALAQRIVAWKPEDVEVVTPDPGPPVVVPQGDDMLVVNHIVEADGKTLAAYAEFIGYGSKNSDGSWHCRKVEWFGPGDTNPGSYYGAVSGDKNIVHQNIYLGTLGLMTLEGNPEEIQDNLMNLKGTPWSRRHFRKVIRYTD